MLNQRVLKGLAVVCTGLSIAAIVLAVKAGIDAGDFDGPSGLVVVNDKEVWVGVEERLWRMSPDGAVKAEDALSALGIPGMPANLVRHPSGAIVATVRDDPTLYFVDPATAHVTRRLTPRWPADLAKHGGRAINLAFRDDGYVAIATGGGHTVALFNANGAFVARTAPGAYEFTNGLWWMDQDLWTTDTNRQTLRRLDGATLSEKQALPLVGHGVNGYLGPARAHPHRGKPGAPMAALVRFTSGMVAGQVVSVAHDGKEAIFPYEATLEPRDLDWLDDDLLVTDSVSSSVLRWSADHRPLPHFGDARFQTHLYEQLAKRDALKARHDRGLALGIALFVLGFAAAAWAQRVERKRHQLSHPMDLSQLGTPLVPRAQSIKLSLRAHALFLVPFVLILGRWAMMGGIVHTWSRTADLISLGGIVLVTAVCVILGAKRLKRLSQQPEFEPVFNAVAVHKLRASKSIASSLRDGERVLETFAMIQATPRWILLTNERLLVFKASLYDLSLEARHELDDIAGATMEIGSTWSGAQARLRINFANAPALKGRVPSVTLATRVTERLARGVGARSTSDGTPLRHVDPPAPPINQSRRWLTTVLSAFIPGLGQWMQGRSSTALHLFVCWLLMAVFISAPLVWALDGPRTAVSLKTIVLAASGQLLMSAMAAWDAWRMAGSDRVNKT